MLDGVDRIALLAVRLVARVGIFDIAVNRPTRRRFLATAWPLRGQEATAG
jgi:hypothetical protein